MFEDHRIAVVVPAYREEAMIGQTLAGIPEFVDHIVVVDDCSPDATADIVSRSTDPRVILKRHAENQGVGGAIVTGHRAALDLGADIMVVMAGDDQMDPVYLPDLLHPLTTRGFGFSKGNRFFSAMGVRGMPRHRMLGNLVLSFLNKAASGYWNLVDPQNGYTAVTRGSLQRIPLDRLSRRYDFENDLLVWLGINSVRAVDVPIPARYGDEVSTLSLHTTVPRILFTLVRGFWRRIWYKYVFWSFSPIALLLFSGLILLGIGTGVGVWAAWNAFQGISPTAGTTLLAVVPFMCGFITLLQAWVLDIMASPD